MNPQKRKKVSNIKQKLVLLSSHRLLLRILSSRRILRRRQLSSRRLQRLSSRQMPNRKSQESSVGFNRILFADNILRIIGKAYNSCTLLGSIEAERRTSHSLDTWVTVLLVYAICKKLVPASEVLHIAVIIYPITQSSMLRWSSEKLTPTLTTFRRSSAKALA